MFVPKEQGVLLSGHVIVFSKCELPSLTGWGNHDSNSNILCGSSLKLIKIKQKETHQTKSFLKTKYMLLLFFKTNVCDTLIG